MLRRLAIAVAAMAVSLCAQSYAHVWGFCQQGGTITVSGLPASNPVQVVYPSCSVTVYQTGTLTKETIYSNTTGTPLANPFTASSAGYWSYYVAAQAEDDVTLSSTNPSWSYTYADVVAPFVTNGEFANIVMTTNTTAGVNETIKQKSGQTGDMLDLQSASGSGGDLGSIDHAGVFQSITANNATFTGTTTADAVNATTVSTAANVVASSATPVFDLSLGNVQTITLTTNATSSSIINAPAHSAIITFVIIENSIGGYSFSWPSNVKGGMTIYTAANAVNTQSFVVVSGELYAIAPGTIN